MTGPRAEGSTPRARIAGRKTGITDEERVTLGRWIDQGAKLE